MSTDQDLNLEKIKAKVQEIKSMPVDVKNRFSVMIPLIKRDGEIHLIFEERAFTLRNQPGEISFPGGRIEEEKVQGTQLLGDFRRAFNFRRWDWNFFWGRLCSKSICSNYLQLHWRNQKRLWQNLSIIRWGWEGIHSSTFLFFRDQTQVL